MIQTKNIICKSIIFLIFTLLIIQFSSCSQNYSKVRMHRSIVDNGFADLSKINFNNEIVKLNGNWFFWQDELLSYSKVEERLKGEKESLLENLENIKSENQTIKVPSKWSKINFFEDSSLLSNYGTLALIVKLPTTKVDFGIRLPDAYSACRLIVNGKYETSIGIVSPSEDFYKPRKGTEYLYFSSTPGDGGVALIVLQIANYSAPVTGTWDSLQIGTNTVINNTSKSTLVLETILVGSILFMGLYHFILFLLRRKNLAPLYFAIICIFSSIRTLIMNERIIAPFFPFSAFGYHFAYAIEHLSIHLCLALFYMFIRCIYPKEVHKIPYYIVLIVSGAWAIIKLFTPLMFSNQLLHFVEYFIVIAGIYMVYCLILAIIRKRNGALILTGGVLFLGIAAFNDILFSNEVIESFYATPIGVFIFSFAQSTFIARDNANNYTKIEQINDELRVLNRSLQRFIPKQILKLLNKKSIIDVKLGDYTAQNMSVLFLDIRNFTSRSEQLSPKENFEFINMFLKEFGPIVRSNAGFIDKYLGDGFMAMFPSDPDFALKAGIAMRNKLKKFNKFPEVKGDVQFGIGIHYGPLMLGTIGESERMDSTAISDTVNSASRLEQLNKVYNTDILISEQLKNNLKHPELYIFTKIGDEIVKGKQQPISVYTVKCANHIDPINLVE